MKTQRKFSAFTSMELLWIIAASIVIIFLLIPALFQARAHAVKIKCRDNLKQIEQTKNLWATNTHAHRGQIVLSNDLVSTNWYLKEWPKCPKDGIYSLGKIGEKPQCTTPGHTI